VEIILGGDADRAALLRLIESDLGGDAAKSLSFDLLAQKGWVEASLAGLTPVRAGRFFIHGSHDRGRVPPNAIAIEIEAALAFGTGHHGTTRGCLLAFDRLMRQAPPQRVLDVGTGSGILAIAAARALHRKVRATDIDPTALHAAKANAHLNRAGADVRLSLARGPQPGARYDLIFANILAGPLVRMSAALARKLARHGTLILSGLLAGQAAAVVSAYRRQGLILERRIQLEEWVTLVMRRR
jgi:ribosomal protein L11 methyltransferase